MKRGFIHIAAMVMVALMCFAGCGHAAKGDAIQAEAQSIELEGVGNARELGGYVARDGRTVKRGAILRTAGLTGATEEDVRRLQEVYHVSVVVDFRSSTEVENAADIELPGAKNLNLPIIDEAAYEDKMADLTDDDTEGLDLTNKIDRLKLSLKAGMPDDQMYVDFLSHAQGQEGYARLFEELLNLPEGEALLFHCSQGKDRTGLAAMLILSALDVDEETIMADFMLTNTFNAALIEEDRQMLIDEGYAGEELDAMMKLMDEVNPQYMLNALNWMRENYGSATGYITSALGVTDEQMEALRDRYLE